MNFSDKLSHLSLLIQTVIYDMKYFIIIISFILFKFFLIFFLLDKIYLVY